MSKKARIFLAEDNEANRRLARIMLEIAGHQVIIEVSSLKEALNKVNSAKKEEINIAVLDGNLGTGLSDGPQIAEALKKAVPGIKIVSFSGDLVKWGDVNPQKPGTDNLVKIVTEL